MSNFTRNVFIASFLLSGLVTNTLERVASRSPANQEEGYELTLQNLNIVQGSKIEAIKNSFVRIVINNKEVIELFKDQKITLASGQSRALDSKFEIKPQWITQDGLEFRIEIVEGGFFENVRLRCSTISKGLSVYNRGYECTVPGETAAVLSYRVSRKGAPLPEVPAVAKN